MLKVENLTKIYGQNNHKVVGIENISFSVNSKEFVSITGPSGSGKSTLLLCLGGLLTPTSGTVFYNDVDIYHQSNNSKLADIRFKNIGFIFQTFNLIPYLTALENIMTAVIPLGLPFKEQISKAEEMLDKVKMIDRKDHKPSELSIGQQQRVAIARAIVNDPKLLIADEPTGNLDDETGADIINLLLDVVSKKSITLVMVTHNISIANKANKLWKIVDGKLININ